MFIVGLVGVAVLIAGSVIGSTALTHKTQKIGASLVIIGVLMLLALLILTP